jgi:hypothetical protein
MRPALQGQNPARDKRAHNVVGADIGGVIELLHVPDDPVGLVMALLGVELPVGPRGCAGNVCRKIDEVFRTAVPDIEKGPLPGPDRVQTGEFVEVASRAGRQDAAPAPDKGFRRRKSPILDRVLPKIIKEREVIYKRGDTAVSLHEGGERRKVEDGIARKMVRLKFIEI